MKISGKTAQIIILILVVLLVSFYFFNEFYLQPRTSNESSFGWMIKDILEKDSIDVVESDINVDDLFKFKVVREDLNQEQIDNYKEQFDQDIQVTVNSPDGFSFTAMNSMAKTKRILHDFEGARDLWEYINLQKPNNSISFFNLGNLYAEDFKNNYLAEINFLRALENSKGEKGNEQYYITTVNFYKYYHTDKQENIEKILLEVLKSDLYKDNQTLLALLAAYYGDNDQVAKAIKYWEKVLELDPGNEAVMREIEKLK